jgi:acetyl esterase/lipase
VAQENPPAAGPQVFKNIQYATNHAAPPRRNQLDVYTPGGPGPHPVVVFIHGGSWRFGSKEFVGAKPDAFTAAGYVFVSINYRLAPAVTHPAFGEDCGKAIAWVHENIRNYSGDPDRIYVMGHSAGAHLAALIATDDRYLKADGLPLSTIKGVIVLDGGGYDIPVMVNSGELFAGRRYRRAFGDSMETWKDASPVAHVEKGKGIPPFLIVHAGQRKASAEQAEEFAGRLRECGVRVEMFNAATKNHLTVNSSIGTSDDETTKTIFDFLKSLRPADGESK